MKRKSWLKNKERPVSYDMYQASVLEKLQAIHYAATDDVYGNSFYNLREISIAPLLKEFKIPAKTFKKMTETWFFWEPSNYNWMIGKVVNTKVLHSQIQFLHGKSIEDSRLRLGNAPREGSNANDLRQLEDQIEGWFVDD